MIKIEKYTGIFIVTPSHEHNEQNMRTLEINTVIYIATFEELLWAVLQDVCKFDTTTTLWVFVFNPEERKQNKTEKTSHTMFSHPYM